MPLFFLFLFYLLLLLLFLIFTLIFIPCRSDLATVQEQYVALCSEKEKLSSRIEELEVEKLSSVQATLDKVRRNAGYNHSMRRNCGDIYMYMYIFYIS